MLSQCWMHLLNLKGDWHVIVNSISSCGSKSLPPSLRLDDSEKSIGIELSLSKFLFAALRHRVCTRIHTSIQWSATEVASCPHFLLPATFCIRPPLPEFWWTNESRINASNRRHLPVCGSISARFPPPITCYPFHMLDCWKQCKNF